MSQLPKRFRQQMYHVKEIPEMDPEWVIPKERAYKLRLYAKMGKASGVDPSLAYPFKDEFEEMMEEEELFEPPLHERIQAAQAKVDEERRLMFEKYAYC